MMWKIQQAMQDDAIRTARIHPAVHPGNRDEVFIWQNFQPALSYEHIENFRKDLEVKRDFGNGASPVNRAHYEESLSRQYCVTILARIPVVIFACKRLQIFSLASASQAIAN